MKKLLLLLLIFSSTSFLYAQENNKYAYCEIFSYLKGMSGKQSVSIDFGQKSELQLDKTYQDSSGQPLVFTSLVDAMNFMATNGWEFVQAYVPVEPVVHFILKKKITEAKEVLKP